MEGSIELKTASLKEQCLRDLTRNQNLSFLTKTTILSLSQSYKIRLRTSWSSQQTFLVCSREFSFRLGGLMLSPRLTTSPPKR